MSDIQEEQKRLYKKAEENDYGDLLRKYNNLKTALDESQEVVISYKEENTRLNNIIDEFDKWLIGEKMLFYKSDDGERLIRFGETKNKWLELKGDNK